MKMDAYATAPHRRASGGADKVSPSGPNSSPKSSRRFRLLHRRDLDSVLRPAWAVKGLLPQTGLAVCYGPSGAGKSFLLLDLVCAIAEGSEWFGRRTTRAPVIYLCLEGAAGFVTRIQAWETARKRSLPELVRCSFQPFELHDPEAVDALLHSVTSWLCCLPEGLPPPIVVIDTLHQATAGTDENSAMAMGDSIRACGRIADETAGLTVLAHHTGKDLERGMRGSNALAAAADAVLLVRRNGQKRVWEAQKVKDGQDGMTGNFELETVVLGLDVDGEQVTSCVVTPGEVSEAPLRQRVPPRLAAALRSLKEVLPHGITLDEDLVVPESQWREAFLADCSAPSSSCKRNALSRARSALLDAGLVAERGDQLEVTEEGRKLLLALC